MIHVWLNYLCVYVVFSHRHNIICAYDLPGRQSKTPFNLDWYGDRLAWKHVSHPWKITVSRNQSLQKKFGDSFLEAHPWIQMIKKTSIKGVCRSLLQSAAAPAFFSLLIKSQLRSMKSRYVYHTSTTSTLILDLFTNWVIHVVHNLAKVSLGPIQSETVCYTGW
jgi:hypothetical protein